MLSDRYFTSLCLFKVQTVRQILSSVTVRPKSECMQFLSTRKFDIPTHVYLRNAGKTDTNLAARSNRCEHFECFELGSFLLTSSTSSPWKCPVCDCLINGESCLYIDQLFTETSLEAQQKTAFGAQ
ncbi:hypothetical protein SJAG_01450 [Schizosaccharomyces japonicus yFS275]|uniref:SP-RING-type domain-containing protein n=1 Tax=Schizosaccharomyces japonicus (strain yFS275 / FY16936) TaxID=402676 RepID=B6JXZ0_SCHJY|nr:hypothetical protein SJAG_01450 [Schizosaccharomyces japonicus yFS275]EEB06408.1 hypothetical protein SJAG_01450 [Schizosaccharomyces japonicus yFS275]